MAPVVSWVEHGRPVMWLGSVYWLEQKPASPTPEGEEKIEQEVAEESNKLSTSEKILIASLFLNVVAFAWSVYQWRVQLENK